MSLYNNNDGDNEDEDDDIDNNNVGFIQLYLNKSHVYMIF